MRYLKLLTFILFCLIMVSKGYAEYWQNFVEYKIDVELDDSKHQLYAHEELIYTNNSPDKLDSLVLLLYPNAYSDTTTEFAREIRGYHWRRFYFSDDEDKGWIEVNNLKVENEESSILPFENNPDVGVVHLENSLNPGESISLSLDFTVKIPIRFSRMLHTGKHYQVVHWYPRMAVYDRRGWCAYPYREMGEFYGEFGNYDVKITVPSNYTIGATGILQNEDERARLDSLAKVSETYFKLSKKERKKWRKKPENKHEKSAETVKTLHYKQDNVIDFAWFADKRFLVLKGKYQYEKSGREVELWTYCVPTVKNDWDRSISYLSEALEYYGEFYGEYPYDALSAVCGPIGSGDGMEYPMISINGDINNNDLVETVVVHEAGHNWFQAILATDEREFPWMDEGMNTFSERRCFNKKHGDDYIYATPKPFKWATPNAKQRNFSLAFNAAMGNSGRNLSVDKKAKDYPVDFIYVNSAFLKPAAYLFLLKEYLGEDNFNILMRDYFDTWKFKHPHPEDFRQLAQKHADKDISWFFDIALKKDGNVDFAVNGIKKDYRDNRFITEFSIKQKGDLDIPAPVYVYHKEEIIKSFWYDPDNKESSYIIKTDLKPSKIVIDHDHYTTDINPRNNTWPRQYALQPIVDLENPDAHQLFFAPVPFYNFMDGVTLSGHLYTFNNAHRNHSIHLSGGYGMVSQNPVYSAGYSYKKYNDNNTNRFLYKIKTMDTYGHRQYSTSFSFKRFPKFREEFTYQDFTAEIFMQEFYKTDYYDYNSWTTTDLVDLRFVYDFQQRFYLDTINSKLRITKGLKNGDFQSDFTRLDLRTSWTHRINMDYFTFLTAYLGWIPESNVLPNQQRFWANGGVDPYFEDLFMFDRSGRTISSPVQHLINKMGPRVRGYNYFSSDENVAIFNAGFIMSPIQLFVDGGLFQDSLYDDKFIMSFGIVYEMGPLVWHLPIYKSDPLDYEGHWIDSRSWKDRYMISLSIPNLQFTP